MPVGALTPEGRLYEALWLEAERDYTRAMTSLREAVAHADVESGTLNSWYSEALTLIYEDDEAEKSFKDTP